MKRSKYLAKKITIDGDTFDSIAEGRWYQNLKLMQRAGAIRNLRRQVRYDLHGLDGSVIATLILDAVWEELHDGEWIEQPSDHKGMETPISRLKRKLFAAEYGSAIRIFTDRGEVSHDRAGRRKRKLRGGVGASKRVSKLRSERPRASSAGRHAASN
jgi:hypothetical protein